MQDILAFLQTLARDAGKLMLAQWGASIQVFEKPDCTIVTEVDLKISELVCARIKRHFPDAGLLTEETSGKLPYPSRTGFIVDELDGTFSYAQRRPGFTFQCAYYNQFGKLQLGLIYDPLRDLMLFAQRGHGAYLVENGKTRTVSRPPQRSWFDLRYGHHRTYMTQTHRKMYAILGAKPENIIPTGSIGSKSIDIVLGKVDTIIALNRKIATWDWAPGKVILQELGYCLRHLTGEKVELHNALDRETFGYLVCPRPHLDRLQQELQWITDKICRVRPRSSFQVASTANTLDQHQQQHSLEASGVQG